MRNKLHSIIVPVYQSREILETLVKTVSEVMDQAGIHFELVLIDDGSQDDSFIEIKRLASLHPFIRGFKLSRNFGHQAALTIGLQKCRGDFVAIIDDDLQDPPKYLPQFFQKLYDGADVVYGVRRRRKEGLLKRILFAGFYRVLNSMSKVNLPNDSGDFCAIKRVVVDAMLQLPMANPFLRGTRSWVGFKQVGIEYERVKRFQGKSGYNIRKYVRLAITGIVMFSYIPLRLATYMGLLASAAGFLYAIGITTYWLFIPFDVPGYLSLIVVITFLGGVQLISVGIIGEYIARMNDNVRSWPVALVAETTSEEQS